MSDYDVVLIGEILVEFYCEGPPADGARIGLGFSGDVLNAAAAASAAGARTAILTAVADDQLGDALVDRVRALGVETALIRRVPGGNGAYLLHGDLSGEREFTYWRTGSAASRLGVADIERERAALTGTRALVAWASAAPCRTAAGTRSWPPPGSRRTRAPPWCTTPTSGPG